MVTAVAAAVRDEEEEEEATARYSMVIASGKPSNAWFIPEKNGRKNDLSLSRVTTITSADLELRTYARTYLASIPSKSEWLRG